MAVDFSNIKSIMSAFNKILKLDSIGKPPTVPPPLILAGAQNRSGVSSIRAASRIIARKSEAGLTSGPLPNGELSPDEIMERIRAEEYFKEILENCVLTIAINPGITLTGVGSSAAGPVSVVGSTITFGTGYGVIQ